MKDDGHSKRSGSLTGRKDLSYAGRLGWIPYLAFCSFGLILALTSIGPSASEGLGTLNTMVFWAAHVIPAIALLAAVQMTLGQSDRLTKLPPVIQVVLSAVFASFLFAPIALGIDSLIAGDGARDDVDDAVFVLLVSELSHFFVPFVLIWTLINAPSLTQLERTGLRAHETGTPVQSVVPARPPDTAETTDFWSRVPGRLGRDLVALSAELHYLRVYTTVGDTLILYPFGKAVDMLQSANGMQVHRSHWVSLDHIDEVINSEGRTLCRMVAGPSLPVSRSFRSALKAARRAAL